MTQSKIAIAKRLADLRQDGSDPEVLAKNMTVMKMHHEIEKVLESEAVKAASAPASEATPEVKEAPARVSPSGETPFKPIIQSIFESFFGSERD